MPRYDDDEDDDRPRRKRSRRYDDDDEDDAEDDDRPRRRRPLARDRDGPAPHSGGVTTVGILTMVIGGLQVLVGCGCGVFGVLFFTGGVVAGQAMANQNRPQQQGLDKLFIGLGTAGGVLMLIGAVIVFAIAALTLWTGYGVLKRQAWARVVTLILATISGLLGLLGVLSLGSSLFFATFRAPVSSLAGNGIGVLLYLGYAILCYVVLLSRSASEEFR